MTEEERYARVAEQMRELCDAGKTDLNPATNLLRGMLHAELYVRNELTHARVMEVRQDFIGILLALVERKRHDSTEE